MTPRKDYYEQLYVNKVEYIHEIEKFLERHTTKTREEIVSLNRSMTSREIILVIKNLPQRKAQA